MIMKCDVPTKGARDPRWLDKPAFMDLSAIVALGLIVVGLENRYHYLSPLGLRQSLSIDKFFGSIQEFDPSQGWVVAKLQIGPPQQALSMMEPPLLVLVLCP
jgi:hypothetical protein